MRLTLTLTLTLTTALAACATDGDPWTGDPLTNPPLRLHGANEGVYPDRSVLTDPDNPFRDGALADDTVWQLQKNGGTVAAFYAWATIMARGANGERQYYTALDLKAIYEANAAVPEDVEKVRALSIRGFQAVLDHFPTAVTYDVTGTIAYELATPCVEAILDLGGDVTGGWTLVTREDGTRVAVRR